MYEDISTYNKKIGELMNVLLSGVSYCDGTYRISRQQAYFYVFEYVIAGEGTIVRNGQKYTARAGDVYWLRQGEDHLYYSSRQNPWEKIWFNINGPFVDALVRIYHPRRTVFPGCDAYAMFREFVSLSMGDFSSPMAAVFAAGKFHEIISYIAHYDSGGFMDDADTLRRYLDEHAREKVGLAEMAAALCRSPSQANRIFLKKYGVTPTRYLCEQKINMAKTLLRDTSLTVRQIAAELSFADEHYFSNVFKKETGLSPKEYRKKSKSPVLPGSGA